MEEEKIIQNGDKNNICLQSFLGAQIPFEYHIVKYSRVIKKLGQEDIKKVESFIENKNGGLIFICDDNKIPYVVFRRTMVLHKLFFNKARIYFGNELMNKSDCFDEYRKLIGIFRITPEYFLNKNLVHSIILQAVQYQIKLILTVTKSESDKIQNYFGNIWDVVNNDHLFSVIRV